jgi:hypothetical protein
MAKVKTVMAIGDFAKLALNIAAVTTAMIANTTATGLNATVRESETAVQLNQIKDNLIEIGENSQIIALYAIVILQ